MGGSSQAGDRGVHRVQCSIEIDTDVETVFAEWSRFEGLPWLMDGVRRTKRIGERRILWDADVAGRQLVWEAEIVELVPDKRIRWESRWGAPNAGEVDFERLPGGRTRLSVDLRCWPRQGLERLGARLGLVKRRIRRDLAQFRRLVERRSAEGELS
jgi:uncharacterized membrane protein